MFFDPFVSSDGTVFPWWEGGVSLLDQKLVVLGNTITLVALEAAFLAQILYDSRLLPQIKDSLAFRKL